MTTLGAAVGERDVGVTSSSYSSLHCVSSMYSVSGLTRRLNLCSTVMSALFKPVCLLCTVLAG